MRAHSISGLFVLFNLASNLLIGSGQNVCKTTTSPCKCDTSDGMIDLSPIDQTSGNPQFYNIPASDGSGSYSYNPCTPYTLNPPGTPNGCANVLGCQQLNNVGQSFALATADSAAWSKDGSGNYVIQMTAADINDQKFRTMTIALTCDPSAETPTFVPSGDSGGGLTYPMILTSKYACPSKQPVTTAKPTPSPSGGGLSFGSILCIIFTVVVVVYLVGGALYNYSRKGARGVEIVPNVEFWKEFPYYVKDGVMFIVIKVKGGGRVGYDSV